MKIIKKIVFIFYKPLTTLSSLSVIFLVYAINKNLTLKVVIDKIGFKNASQCLFYNMSDVWSYIIYEIILIFFTFLLLKGYKCLPHFDMTQNTDTNNIMIEPVDSGMMITYFGLFFFALSVNNIVALVSIFLVLFICILFSNVYMFNPLLYFFRYKFYYVTLNSGKKCLLISKTKYAYGDVAKYNFLYKINEYTYIE